MGPSSLGDNQTEKFVPPAEETALRQTRWQKVIYPNKITRKLSIGFKPYTLVATLGPSNIQNAQWAASGSAIAGCPSTGLIRASTT